MSQTIIEMPDFENSPHPQGLNASDPYCEEYRSIANVKFGQLLDDGWDWGMHKWYSVNATTSPYLPVITPKLREYLNSRINAEYWNYELGDYPAQHSRNMVRRLNVAGEKLARFMQYPPEYWFSQGKTTTQYRKVDSDYPQSQIKTNGSDYATSAEDYEALVNGDIDGRVRLELYHSLPFMTELVESVRDCFSPIIYYGRIEPNDRLDAHMGW